MKFPVGPALAGAVLLLRRANRSSPGKLVNEIDDRCFQSFRQLGDNVERGHASASFQEADVGAMQPGEVGKPLLRQTALQAAVPHDEAKTQLQAVRTHFGRYNCLRDSASSDTCLHPSVH